MLLQIIVKENNNATTGTSVIIHILMSNLQLKYVDVLTGLNVLTVLLRYFTFVYLAFYGIQGTDLASLYCIENGSNENY